MDAEPASLRPEALDRSVPWIIRDATLAEVMNTLTAGTLLASMSLAVGCSVTVVGLISGIAALFQVFQLAATVLIERTRQRKTIALISAVSSRALWLVAAGVLLFTTGKTRIWALVGVMAVRAVINAFYICASNSWMRDVVPDATMGDFYSRRMRSSYLAALLTGLVAGFIVNQSTAGRLFPDAISAYAFLLVCAFAAGELAAMAMSRVAEPAMPERRTRLLEALSAPLRDARYRSFLAYLAAWNVTTAMAAPLYTVFLMKRFGYPILWVVVLETAGKLVHLASLGPWGKLADARGSRHVVAMAQPLYWVSLLLWPVAGVLGGHARITPVIIAGIYVLNRAAAAGIGIGNNTLAMQLSPRGRASGYLALRSQVTNPVLFLAPLAAGLLVDGLDKLAWFKGGRSLDAVLLLAALFGIASAALLRRLGPAKPRMFSDAGGELVAAVSGGR
jgi:hypothetical protein